MLGFEHRQVHLLDRIDLESLDASVVPNLGMQSKAFAATSAVLLRSESCLSGVLQVAPPVQLAHVPQQNLQRIDHLPVQQEPLRLSN